MKTFKINFVHTVEEYYEAFVDAETEDEAKEMFDENPFEYCNGLMLDQQGLDIKIENIEKL